MQDITLIKEPIDFIFSEKLLSGSDIANISENIPEIVKFFFKNDEKSIIYTMQEEVSKFRFNSNYDSCEELVNHLLDENNEKLKKKYFL